MHKNLILLSVFFSTACTYGQQPAPFDVYGTRYYGKDGHAELRNEKDQPANSPLTGDYNKRIDAENSTRITSRPLGSTRENPDFVAAPPTGKPGEVYSHQLTDSAGNSRRALAPVAIDGDQQVVRVDSRSIHSGGSYASNTVPREGFLNKEPVRIEETVPPIEHKEGYINEKRWKKALPEAEDIIARALSAIDVRHKLGGEVSVLLTNDTEIQVLNKTYRDKDKPTNVLSFPQDEPGLLGDIAMALETLEHESMEQDKTLSDHFTHLFVHGVLHLMGHDHMETAEQAEMEALEIKILAGLNIQNPY